MTNFSKVITSGNLKFGTTRSTGSDAEGLPSLYFLDDKGHFVRIRPYHNEGFAIIKRESRTIFFLTESEYDQYKKDRTQATGSELDRLAPEESQYDGITLRTGDTYRVVDYTRTNAKPHKGHYLITPQQIRSIYKELKIDLDELILYCSKNTEEDSNAYIGEGPADIIAMLQEGFPLD